MEQSLKEIQHVFLFYVIGFFVFLLILYPAVVFFDIKKYKFPSLINLTLVSLASAIGFFAFCKILGVFFFFLSHFIISNPAETFFNPEIGKGAGFFVSLLASAIAPFFFFEETKKPRHDQKEVVELSDDTPLSEIKKIVSEKFPNTDLMKIKVFSGFPEKNDVLCFLPYDLSSFFVEHDDSFSTKAYYPSPFGLVLETAKEKDPELKNTNIFFFNGELCISIKK